MMKKNDEQNVINKLKSFWTYWKGITRVTEIVSFVFPFKNTDGEALYKKWLADKGIDEKEYMFAAQTLWTFIHNNIENHILWKPIEKEDKLYKECNKEIDSAIEWLSTLSPKQIYPEVFVKEANEICNGTIDLLYQNREGEWIIGDWKNFWKAKQRFWLNHSPTIPTAKRKKVRLQMSIYAYILKQIGIDIKTIQLLSLTEEGIKVVEMDVMSDREIEAIFSAFQEHKINWTNINVIMANDIKDVKSPLRIRIQTAPIAYSAVEVELNLADLDGIEPTDAINELVAVQKKLHNSYLENNGN